MGLAALDGDELEPVVVSERVRGRGVGRALVERVVGEARVRGLPRVRVRPVARNDDAIRFFHAAGFDVAARVELQLDFEDREWSRSVELASRSFRA